MTPSPIVYVVDDDVEFGRSLEIALAAASLRVRHFTSAEAFLEAYDPDAEICSKCLVLDMRLPGISGLELQRRLVATRRALPIIILSGKAEIPMAVEAVKAGAIDFLEKPVRRSVLLERVQTALACDVRDRDEKAKLRCFGEFMSRLTQREREVLQMMIDGKNNKSIAISLGISMQTAAKHTSRVLSKLELQNVVELANLMHAAKA